MSVSYPRSTYAELDVPVCRCQSILREITAEAGPVVWFWVPGYAPAAWVPDSARLMSTCSGCGGRFYVAGNEF